MYREIVKRNIFFGMGNEKRNEDINKIINRYLIVTNGIMFEKSSGDQNARELRITDNVI